MKRGFFFCTAPDIDHWILHAPTLPYRFLCVNAVFLLRWMRSGVLYDNASANEDTMFHATYNSDDIYATFTAEVEVSDYGVPGSPTLYDPDPDTIEVTSLTILGIDVDFGALPKGLQDAILSLDLDWRQE